MAIDFSEIYGTLKSRVRNPYFGSFIVSWFFINWKVLVGLFVMTSDEIKELGHPSWIAFVDSEVCWWSGLFAPALSAIVVTVVTPFIVAGYKIVREFAEDQYIKERRKDPEKRHIKMEIYLELWETYDKKLEQLQNAIDKAEIFKTEREKLEAQVDQLEKEKSILERAKNEIHSDLKQLDTQLNIFGSEENIPKWLQGNFKMEMYESAMWVKIENLDIYETDYDGNIISRQFRLYKPRIMNIDSRIIIGLVTPADEGIFLIGISDLQKNKTGNEIKGEMVTSQGISVLKFTRVNHS